MKKITTTVLAIALSAGALAAAPAYAKGGDGGEARAKLAAERAALREKNGSTSSGGSFFERLFGGEPERAEGSKTKTQQ